MKRYFNIVNSQIAVGFLILIHITSTVCFYDDGTVVHISNMSEVSANSFDERRHWYDSYVKVVITDNNFTTLPEDIFNGLAELRTLNIVKNPLTTLPPNIFKELFNLKKLSLSQNQLTALPENILHSDPHLLEFDVNGNQLATLSKDIFQNQTELRKLNLGGNKLKTLSKSMFSARISSCKVNLYRNPWLCDDEFLEIGKILEIADIDDFECPDGQLYGYKIGSEVCP